MSSLISLLYFIIFAYGGCANKKSIQLSSTIPFKFVESALISFGSYKLSLLKIIRSFAIFSAFTFISIPYSFPIKQLCFYHRSSASTKSI